MPNVISDIDVLNHARYVRSFAIKTNISTCMFTFIVDFIYPNDLLLYFPCFPTQ